MYVENGCTIRVVVRSSYKYESEPHPIKFLKKVNNHTYFSTHLREMTNHTLLVRVPEARSFLCSSIFVGYTFNTVYMSFFSPLMVHISFSRDRTKLAALLRSL